MESSSKTSRLPYLGQGGDGSRSCPGVLLTAFQNFNLDFASYPLSSNQDFRQSGRDTSIYYRMTDHTAFLPGPGRTDLLHCHNMS